MPTTPVPAGAREHPYAPLIALMDEIAAKPDDCSCGRPLVPYTSLASCFRCAAGGIHAGELDIDLREATPLEDMPEPEPLAPSMNLSEAEARRRASAPRPLPPYRRGRDA